MESGAKLNHFSDLLLKMPNFFICLKYFNIFERKKGTKEENKEGRENRKGRKKQEKDFSLKFSPRKTKYYLTKQGNQWPKCPEFRNILKDPQQASDVT